jgi:alpha-glucosidase
LVIEATMRVTAILLFLALVTFAAAQEKDWWQTANFYQIYPRSFRSSKNKPVGDIRGIIEKLPYLKELGVTATWLSPILKSPQVDNGYDIQDFKEVDSLFGTNADLEELFTEAKKLGIKIIMDFVPNHTSDLHEWFVKSKSGDPQYKDYYVWHPGKPNPLGGRNLPPNNWVSKNLNLKNFFVDEKIYFAFTASSLQHNCMDMV